MKKQSLRRYSIAIRRRLVASAPRFLAVINTAFPLNSHNFQFPILLVSLRRRASLRLPKNLKVKIGDLGFAAIVGKNHLAHSIVGTPEYMAPELYEEDYTEIVDIYSFGLCLLEMVTMEIPYSECDSVAKTYKKVTTGIKPLALNKVNDPEVKAFIEKAIGEPRARPTASDLLRDPFLSEVNQ